MEHLRNVTTEYNQQLNRLASLLASQVQVEPCQDRLPFDSEGSYHDPSLRTER